LGDEKGSVADEVRISVEERYGQGEEVGELWRGINVTMDVQKKVSSCHQAAGKVFWRAKRD
jgi:hypothetical protein